MRFLRIYPRISNKSLRILRNFVIVLGFLVCINFQSFSVFWNLVLYLRGSRCVPEILLLFKQICILQNWGWCYTPLTFPVVYLAVRSVVSDLWIDRACHPPSAAKMSDLRVCSQVLLKVLVWILSVQMGLHRIRIHVCLLGKQCIFCVSLRKKFAKIKT